MDSNTFHVIWMTLLALCLLGAPLYGLFRKKSLNKKLVLLVYVLLLIWIIRFLVSVFGNVGTAEELSVTEMLLDSLIHTLQTFSMDEDYTLYTTAGKELLTDIGYPLLASVYGFVISLLNVCAPILGGALLLDILTSILPGLHLLLMPHRHKFVFSELNEESITLAEDIVRHAQDPQLKSQIGEKSAIVFAEAHSDEDVQIDPELRARARAIGAICLKADLLHISLKRSKSADYFLISANRQDNIITLMQLIDGDEGGEVLWPVDRSDEPVTRIYLFGQDALDSDIVRRIIEKNAANEKKVLIRTIRDAMVTAFDLMDTAPLFLPLLSKEEQARQDLYVTILGSGRLAEEVFKTVYWCGQMQDVRLHVHVVDRQASAMEKKLAEECPELLESCRVGAELLKVRPFADDSPMNPPYFQTLRFIDLDNVEYFSEYPKGLLEQTDYFVAALDEDEQNLRITTQLRRMIERTGIDTRVQRHPVIASAVSDQNLAEAVRVLQPKDFEPYIIPYASLTRRYSYESVFMETFFERGAKGGLYNRQMAENLQKDEYNYWSSIARRVHAPYKLFGLGLLQEVCLEKKNKEKYPVKPNAAISELQQHQIAWVEHRRWNAYLRAQGFCCATKAQHAVFYQMDRKHKNISLKLHPCLVESQLVPEALPGEAVYDKARYDGLDHVSMNKYELELQASGTSWNEKDLNAGEYKQYDYPAHDRALQYFLQ